MSASRHTRRSPRAMNVLFIIAIVILLSGGTLFAWASLVSIPSLDNFENRRVGESTKIYDRTGEVVLYEIYGEERRTVLPPEEIPDVLRNATIAIEDAGFYRRGSGQPVKRSRDFSGHEKS